MNALSPALIAEWVGRERSETDMACPRDAQRLAAVLGRTVAPADGEPLPACWHWMLFQPMVPNNELGPDGHPKAGEFLPALPLPRRMFTGIEVKTQAPLLLGDTIRRRSAIEAITPKEGKSGALVFVTMRHIWEGKRSGVIVEKHSFVYRGADSDKGKPASPPAPASEPAWLWQEAIKADPVLVFRFAAAVFNAHRIHYDRPYATEVEHYAERLVPGRLAALLLLEALGRRTPRALARFAFQAKKPIWVGETMTLEGMSAEADRVDLRIRTGHGTSAMQASAVFAT
jgi:3-methylfumaryl-CoA hydratase